MAKKAIVMGATSGIGMEVAKLLAAKGWQVGIAGRRIERMQALIAEGKTTLQGKTPLQKGISSDGEVTSQGGITCYQQIDVTSPNAPAQFLELIEKLGGMDLYFHSSGIGWQNNTLDIEKELKTLETNGLGFTRMVDTAFNWFAAQSSTPTNKSDFSVPESKKKANHACQKFRIACITSIAGTKGLGAAPAYSATKRFQNHYLECLSQQARMRHLPIAITDIRPGFVKTDLIAGSSYPLQLKPEDVAKHIVNAIENGVEVKVIDWRYDILVFLWRLIPRWLWTRLRITT